MSGMGRTVFAKILEEVVAAIPGALGAVFVDWEGEAVDTYSRIGDTNVRIVGAHWCIAYYQAHGIFTKLGLLSPLELVLRFADQQVIIRRVTEEYLVVLAMSPEGNLGRALHLLSRADEKLREQM